MSERSVDKWTPCSLAWTRTVRKGQDQNVPANNPSATNRWGVVICDGLTPGGAQRWITLAWFRSKRLAVAYGFTVAGGNFAISRLERFGGKGV
jgi:hypothetical protein